MFYLEILVIPKGNAIFQSRIIFVNLHSQSIFNLRVINEPNDCLQVLIMFICFIQTDIQLIPPRDHKILSSSFW